MDNTVRILRDWDLPALGELYTYLLATELLIGSNSVGEKYVPTTDKFHRMMIDRCQIYPYSRTSDLFRSLGDPTGLLHLYGYRQDKDGLSERVLPKEFIQLASVNLDYFTMEERIELNELFAQFLGVFKHREIIEKIIGTIQ